jgi:flagellar hook-associated protein 2
VSRSELLELGTFVISDPGGAIDGTNLQVSGVDAFEVDGNVLRGLAGTVYEGMSLAYSRDTSDAGVAAQDITITTTTGVAERLYQHIDNYINSADGLITDEVNRLTAQNEDYNDKILALEDRLALYQTSLIEKYSAMEQAIAQAEAMAEQLSAFLKSGDD